MSQKGTDFPLMHFVAHRTDGRSVAFSDLHRTHNGIQHKISEKDRTFALLLSQLDGTSVVNGRGSDIVSLWTSSHADFTSRHAMRARSVNSGALRCEHLRAQNT